VDPKLLKAPNQEHRRQPGPPAPKCECGAEDHNARLSYRGVQVPHALNCPTRPAPPANVSEESLSDIYSRMDVSGVFSNDLKLRFAEEIAKMKAVRDIAQIDLAKAAGITQPRMSLIEGGSENCTFCTVERTVRALNARIIFRLEPVEDKNFGKDLTHYVAPVKPPSNGPGRHPVCVSGDPDVNAASVASVTAGETAANVSDPKTPEWNRALLLLNEENAALAAERDALKAQNAALQEAHDHAQTGLKSARKQEGEMREKIAALTAELERLRDLIVQAREWRFSEADTAWSLVIEARAIHSARAAREAGKA